jgi:hypothetical protein
MRKDFIFDKAKMVDFFILSKDEFLASYSYLEEEEYDDTVQEVIDCIDRRVGGYENTSDMKEYTEDGSDLRDVVLGLMMSEWLTK